MPITRAISKKQKFVADGVFFAELNEFFTRCLAEDGYSGLEIRVTPQRTELIIRATRTQGVLGERGRRIKELTSLVQKRFGFADNTIELFVERVENRGLCAIAQCESLKFKLLGEVPVRKACHSILRFIMESGARGCEIVVSGKLRGQRAKSMKFIDGFMIHAGNPSKEFIDQATRHVLLRQGVIGVRIKIMLPTDPTGRTGPKYNLPDIVTILDPKSDESKTTVTIESVDSTATAPSSGSQRPQRAPQSNYNLEDGMNRMNLHAGNRPSNN
jgi:small subunit ribosomal protein S3e